MSKHIAPASSPPGALCKRDGADASDARIARAEDTASV
jgi:hypothetical protein